MQKEQHGNVQIEMAFAVRLLKMLLCNKVINQSTYDKIMKMYRLKEVV